MILWTIQPLSLYQKLQEHGTLHCDPNDEGFLGLECKEFRDAYDWLVDQMKIHVGLPPKGVRYPFWAWTLIDGVSKKPDLRRTEFNNYVGECVIMELEIPDCDVLLSDEENWHYVLNNAYLHDVNDEEGKWEETDAWFDGLTPSYRDSVRRKSWERIFEKNSKNNNWKFVQATFWELRIGQVCGVRKFTGRGKSLSNV